jgi:predicted acyltransferase
MDPNSNLVAWLDRRLFMGHLYNGTRGPEGLLSTIPAIGTTLIGVLTGHWLRSNTNTKSKLLALLAAGGVGLTAGLLWDRWFPINKNLWTSSFVLFSGGFSLLMLGGLYWALEIRKWQGRWTMPILVFGMNAIAGFVADSFVYGPGYTFTATSPAGARVNWHEAAQTYMESFGLNTASASLVYSIAAVAFCWCLLWILWRKKIFLKI